MENIPHPADRSEAKDKTQKEFDPGRASKKGKLLLLASSQYQ
jgi:hypothetical protein